MWLRRLWSGNKVRYQYQLSTYRPWRARSDACEVSFQHHPAYFPLREHHRDDLFAYPAERRFALPIALLCSKEYPSGHTRPVFPRSNAASALFILASALAAHNVWHASTMLA
jgi:hypothetical protein